MARHRRKQHDCPNCGTPLAPEFEFCPTCGQENHELKVPFRHLVYELIEGLTHFDAKAWNTLRAMARPGRITEEFLVGRRARYVPPVRLYIFVSVVFFFLLSALTGRRLTEQEADEQAGSDRRRKEQVPAPAPPRDRVPEEDGGPLSVRMELTDSMQNVLVHRVDGMTTPQIDSVLTGMGNKPSWYRRRLFIALLHVPQGDEANGYLAHLFTRSLSILMFLLMPFFALLLKMLFARRRLYYEHLIFSIHTHTAFFLLFSTVCALGLVLEGALQSWISGLAWIMAALYLLVALRRVYRRSWVATIGLSAVMVIPYFVAFVVLALVGTLFGFLLH